jgi:hypothetical protein
VHNKLQVTRKSSAGTGNWLLSVVSSQVPPSFAKATKYNEMFISPGFQRLNFFEFSKSKFATHKFQFFR